MSPVPPVAVPAAEKTSPKRAEWLSALIVLVLGAPMIFLFTRAMADGEQRRREAPLRAMLGERTFERLARGVKTEVLFLGISLAAGDFTL